jgi:hypothetical protein
MASIGLLKVSSHDYAVAERAAPPASHAGPEGSGLRPTLPARQGIGSYARRMNTEQRLAEAIQSFYLDALADAVPLNVDFDVTLSVLAHTVCAALRRRLPATMP